jgi:hypothetical protein
MYLNKMKYISDIIYEKKIKLENLKFENATKFYKINIKEKIFRLLFSNYEINIKLQKYFINIFKNKRKKHIVKSLFKKIKASYKYSKFKEIEVKDKIKKTIKLNFSKKLLKALRIIKEDSNDIKLKQDLIKKLKEKASYLIGSNSLN